MKKMRKSIYLFALLTLTLFTSCADKNEDDSKQTFTATINSRAIDGDQVIFNQGKGEVEVNFTTRSIQFSGDFKDASGHTQSLNSPSMQLTNSIGSVYTFNGAMYDLKGSLDMATGMMLYSFSLDDGTTVVCSTHLMYAYATTTVTNEQGATYEHQQSAYLFTLDSKGENCTLQISNFIPDTNGAVQASVIGYKNLKVTPTATGYVITGNDAEPLDPVYSSLSVSDLNFVIDNQCLTISGTFSINKHTFNVSGPLFPREQRI